MLQSTRGYYRCGWQLCVLSPAKAPSIQKRLSHVLSPADPVACAGKTEALTAELQVRMTAHLAQPLPAKYDPEFAEQFWYNWWEQSGLFKPDQTQQPQSVSSEQNKKVFSMVLPPPNVTGSLHLGHALTVSIEDSLTRW